MNTKEKYVIGEHIYILEEKCIQVIEKELDSFFEVRLNFINLIHELYIKGSIINSDDITSFLVPSNDEIKTFIETVVYKISGVIKYNLSANTIYFNFLNTDKYYIKYIECYIDEFTKTEKILSLCERVLDKTLSQIFRTYCQSKIINYVFDVSNLPEKLISNNSLKHQRQKHGIIIFEQLTGFILNLKCDLRNDLVKSIILLVNCIY